ncbi:hypothetical protein ACK2LO_002492 [Acinetobacter baumannii]|uniref:hypothetical protein n=1 Tax=Acinetobacter baumannii TaxID=470 RepID=UPI0002CFB1F7|nr:hypothetical protein [Acinetobacter baumannii]ENU67954.1 hypothetical protein F978_03777 [Acinetobacter baumannii NIPH 615]EKW0221006.1 hypothetical protein [Acinetobacter baumannii]EKY1632908.1 hypothetical protein [Acinetobacter baumannii]EME4799919.1 hypothetical protein [Acinetobacter baumannii]EME6128239.1 hypothetical protein [Acinetobacter baumannii]
MTTLRKRQRLKRNIAKLREHFKLTGEFLTVQTKHGTSHAYATYKCRCSECINYYVSVMRPRITENNQRYFQKAKKYFSENGQLPDNVEHGRTGYSVGCRCKICKRTNSFYAADLRQRKKLAVKEISQRRSPIEVN